MIKRVTLLSAAFAAVITLNGCTMAPPPAVAKSGSAGGKQYYTEDAPALGSNMRRRYATDDPQGPGQGNVEQGDMREARSGAGLGSQMGISGNGIGR